MANSAQAKKRAKQAENRRQHNASIRTLLRTLRKKVLAAIANKDKTSVTTLYKALVKNIDRQATKGLIHKNVAARIKSKANKRIKESFA